MVINLGEEECNVSKTTYLQSRFNKVRRRKSDSTKAFLEHLDVQIVKILPRDDNHGGGSGWSSTWHNSTDAKIKALDQHLNYKIISKWKKC